MASQSKDPENELIECLSHNFNNKVFLNERGSVLIAIKPPNQSNPDLNCFKVLFSFWEKILKLSNFTPVVSGVNQTSDQMPHLFNESKGFGSHSIIFSGESGSGKSECSKLFLLKYFSGVQDTSTEQKDTTASILLTHNILESFGHAQTIANNNNSSRFGRYLDLQFNSKSDLIGGNIRTYLLENTRVTSQQSGEQNFFIFYQLLAGASSQDKERWHLSENEVCGFKILNHSDLETKRFTAAEINKIKTQNESHFNALKQQFESLRFDSAHIAQCFSVIAGLLHLGNVEFASVSDLSGESSEVVSQQNNQINPLNCAAELMGLDSTELGDLLTMRVLSSRDDVVKKRLTVTQANNARDALIKAVYRKVFNWLVAELNSKIAVSATQPDSEVTSHIALVDLTGTDSSRVNNFELLCVNYANEVMQQHFNQHAYSHLSVLQEYSRDDTGIEGMETKENISGVTRVQFVENVDTIDLISSIVFKTLDDQCKLAHPTDSGFLSQLYAQAAQHSRFTAAPHHKRDNMFAVQHFSGEVEYSGLGFVAHNLDELPLNAFNLLHTSSNVVLSCVVLAPADVDDGSNQAAHSSPSRRNSANGVAATNTASTPARSGSFYGSNGGGNTPFMSPLTRRSSFSRASPTSLSQFRQELSSLVKLLSSSTPHYVRCVNPIAVDTADDGAVSMTKTFLSSSAAPKQTVSFDKQRVLQQLRVGGFLDIVLQSAGAGGDVRDNSVPVSVSDEAQTVNTDDAPVSEEVDISAIVPCTIETNVYYEANSTVAVAEENGSDAGLSTGEDDTAASPDPTTGSSTSIIPEESHDSPLQHMQIEKLLTALVSVDVEENHKPVIPMLSLPVGGTNASQSPNRLSPSTRQLSFVVATEEELENNNSPATSASSPGLFPTTFQSLDKKVSSLSSVSRDSSCSTPRSTRSGASSASRRISAILPKGFGPLQLDVAKAKKLLSEWAEEIPRNSFWFQSLAEVIHDMDFGYNLLLPQKLIPPSTLSRVLSLGRKASKSSSASSRPGSVRFAAKCITAEHKVFRNLVFLVLKIKECLRIMKEQKKEMVDTKHLLETTYANNSDNDESAAAVFKEQTKLLDAQFAFTSNVYVVCKTVCRYYEHYHTALLREYGDGSAYKNSFRDDNLYILALVEKFESKQPLLVEELPENSVAKKIENW